MADFRMRKDAEQWFKHIASKPPLKTKFDLYYCCLMLGLAAKRKSRPSDAGAAGFVDHIPEDFKPVQELIVGLLLRAEIESMGVALTERDEVRRMLAELVGTNGLSADGVSRMNEYSSGGFEALADSMDEPRTVPEFMFGYEALLRQQLG